MGTQHDRQVGQGQQEQGAVAFRPGQHEQREPDGRPRAGQPVRQAVQPQRALTGQGVVEFPERDAGQRHRDDDPGDGVRPHACAEAPCPRPADVEGHDRHVGQHQGDRPVDEIGVGVGHADRAAGQGPAGQVVAAVAPDGNGGEGQRREYQEGEPGRALVLAYPPREFACVRQQPVRVVSGVGSLGCHGQ